jgi:signal transduction histidine kinase
LIHIRLAAVVWWFSVFLIFATGSAIAAERDQVISFESAKFAFSESDTPPVSGWSIRPLPQLSLEEEARRMKQHHMTVWVRLRFDRQDIGTSAQALYTQDIAERYIAYLNGTDIHRTYAGKDERTIGWNRPVLVTLPAKALRPGMNELLLRVDSSLDWFLFVGQVKIGPIATLRPLYNSRYFWRIKGAATANYIMLVLTVIAFMLWLRRHRQEPELAWLIALGIAYFVRNSVFFFETSPIDPFQFGILSQSLLFMLTPLSFGFSAEYLKIKHRVGWNQLWFALAFILALGSLVLALLGYEGRICTAIFLLVGIWSIIVIFRARWVGDRFSRGLLLTTVAVTVGGGIHDLGRQDHLLLWDGAGFFLQPYNGFAIFVSFFLLVGRRFVSALDTVESLNASLETRIADAQTELAASEAARRTLEVERALEVERERLMHEVHDGIGSSLVTALAVAQREQHSEDTINLLRRAVSDLKITVDSLDPMQGDLLALLGNVRHRLEPDLKRAGIETRWTVEDCPALDWLDPANALQFLRLIQEAVSNAIAHACASEIRFSCAPQSRTGRRGLLVEISDNGHGFEYNTAGDRAGKGLANMRARAESLQGELTCVSTQGVGTDILLWLPLDRRRLGRLAEDKQ